MRLLIAVAATLVLSLVLAVAYPDVMIKPGQLSAGHRSLDRDCLRCHTLLEGASAANCRSCHTLADIGRRTTAGVALPGTGPRKVVFHASLANTDCLECHTVHSSARHRREASFQHGFLAAEIRNDCGSCHLDEKPADARHERLRVGCASCHTPEAWSPASFDHGSLAPTANCISCHQENRPKDELHRQVSDRCGTCHGTASWRPATFDHARYFRFDSNHPGTCATCHTGSDAFATYTCYGCHEHAPARIAAEHREEGIGNFQDCARCHRSGNEDEAEGGERERWEGEGEEDGDE